MGGFKYSREDLFKWRKESTIKDIGKKYISDLRMHGVCVDPTHRGNRGSKHCKMIPTLVSARDSELFCGMGVNYGNLTETVRSEKQKKTKTKSHHF